MANASIAMIRSSLDDIPQFPLTPPYTVRWYRPGDEAAWVRIHVAADKFGTFPPGKFREQFGADERLLAERQLYLCDADGAEIGTATAWFNDDYRGQRFGRVHWVAIVPEMQGRGLAKPLLAAVCERLLALGHDRAYLTTNAVREAALNLYLLFGFVPDIRAPHEVRAWLGVRGRIKAEYWARAVAAAPELA